MQPGFVSESANELVVELHVSLRQGPVLSKRTHRRCDMRVVAERNCHVALKANAGRL